MDKILLKQKIGKWNDACRFLKGHQADLSTAEWSAVELLADFWRMRKFDDELVEESKELIATLVAADKLHSNNRDIITWSKEFRGIAKTMYTESAANFAEFQAAMRAFAQEHAPRQRAPQPQQPRPTPPPPRPQPRPTPPPPRPQPQPRPAPAPQPRPRATLRIAEVRFRNVDRQGNPAGSGSVDGSEPILYLRPVVNCHILEPSDDKDIWYKIFTPGGRLLGSSASRAGFTWHGVVSGRQGGWTSLGGFGNDDGSTFAERGRYRVEFYEGDVKLYETSLLIDGGAAGGASGGSAARRPQPVANIRITAADFFETDGGNQVFGRARDGFATRLRYVCPEITYTVLRPTGDKDVWYKIYKPGGTLMIAVEGREGFTWKGKVNGRTGGTVSLGAFGDKDGTAFNEVGWYRVEFYENDVKVFESRFYVAAAPARPEPRQEMPPIEIPPQPQSPREDDAFDRFQRKRRRRRWLIVAAVVGVIWFLSDWGPVFSVLLSSFDGQADTAEAPTVAESAYVFADKLVLRSSKEAGSTTNQRAVLAYGTEVGVESDSAGWSQVRANGRSGYVASDYLLSAEDFRLLDGVFADKASREVVNDTKARLALLDFLKRKNLATDGGKVRLKAFGEEDERDDVCWKLELIDGRVSRCFGFVLTVEGTEERPWAVYLVAKDKDMRMLDEGVVTERGSLQGITYDSRTGRWTCRIGR